MTISCFSEVAHHPTSMWVSVAHSSYTHELLAETGKFSFIALHQHQTEIALACGTESGRTRNKCSALDLLETDEGDLFLRNAIACTACRVTKSVDLGDHTLFVAAMVNGVMNTRLGLYRQLLLSDLLVGL